jgi:cobalt-zinc-cadmium efflux system membrane fusion protein
MREQESIALEEQAAAPEAHRGGEAAAPARRRVGPWIAGGVALAGGLAALVLTRSSPPPAAPVAPSPVARPSQAPADDGANPIAIAESALAKNPIATAKAQRTKLAPDLQIVGSVSYDQDHYAVVGPLIPGRVTKLRAGVGDTVRAGQVLAEIESAEVGQALAQYLSATARANAAEANLRRERELASQKISSEREREVAEAQAVQEAAEMRAAVERLRAFGLEMGDIRELQRAGGAGGRVPLRAPIGGTIVARTITLGQAVERATDAFKIVNLSHLWVLLDLYEKDLSRVHVGQKVELRTEAYPGEVFRAEVTYVNPIIDEKTRTASVRIEFDNPKGKLQPGQFVSAKIIGDPKYAPADVIAIPRKAVVSVEGKPLVFVRAPGRGFERRVVELGVSGGDLVEVRRGVAEGEEVATDGAFLLKSELLR